MNLHFSCCYVLFVNIWWYLYTGYCSTVQLREAQGKIVTTVSKGPLGCCVSFVFTNYQLVIYEQIRINCTFVYTITLSLATGEICVCLCDQWRQSVQTDHDPLSLPVSQYLF